LIYPEVLDALAEESTECGISLGIVVVGNRSPQVVIVVADDILCICVNMDRKHDQQTGGHLTPKG
jgi:hypothetical protein